MTKILCIGDIHFGAGTAYGREPGDRLRDQERVWTEACTLAAEERVAAVALTGDVFHRPRPTPAEQLAFWHGLEILATAQIPCLTVVGNHDCAGPPDTNPTALDLFAEAGVIELWKAPAVKSATDRPLAGTSVAFLPWTPASHLVALRDGTGDRDRLHAELGLLLAETAADLRAMCADDKPAILLGHWSVSGASLPTGITTDELREPIIPLSELEAQGWDAIVLGHIHRWQWLGGEDSLAFYTGSPNIVDFGETGYEHGVVILDTEPSGDEPHTRWVPLADRPFISYDADFTNGDDFSQLMEQYEPNVSQLRDAIVRVRYTATEEQARRIAHAALTRALYDAGAHRVVAIQPTILRSERARVEGLTEDVTPLAALDLYISEHPERVSVEVAAGMRERTAAWLEAA